VDEKYGEDVASKPVEGANQGKGNFTNRHTALRLIGGGIRRASFCARTSTSSTPGPTARETCGRGISGPSTTLTCPREPITLSPGKTRGKRLPRSVRVAKGIDLLRLRSRRTFVHGVQARLCHLGLLAPPVDGDLGPVSHWAWRTFSGLHSVSDTTCLITALARVLLADSEDDLFPLDTGGHNLASRIVRSLRIQVFRMARHPTSTNIVQVKGHDPDGEPNANPTARYIDLRFVAAARDGRPVLLDTCPATKQPGWHYILKPLDGTNDPVKAAAQILIGRYMAGCVGEHGGSAPQEALVQRDRMRVHRDGQRRGVPEFERADYGINQQHGSNSGCKYSAGSMVATQVNGHREFMAIVNRNALPGKSQLQVCDHSAGSRAVRSLIALTRFRS